MQIRANGLSLEVEEHGSATGEPLLLIMGLGMQLLGWHEGLVDQLVERGFRVIRFDNRDIGLSQSLNAAGVPNLALDSLRHALGLSVRSPYSLADMAADSVGVLDADIYGYSIPRMLGATQDPTVIDQMLLPPEAWGVRCISIGYFVEEGQAVVWRGPMLHKALEQFLTDVFWDEPDFLLIDMPPGTGDIALSLSQYLPRGEVYVVTTPQPAAQEVAALSAAMAAKVNLPVKGIIENMSWFTGDDGKRYELFGAGCGAELAGQLDVPLLAQIPLVPALREGGDDGHPIVVAHPDDEAAVAFRAVAERLDTELTPKRIYRPELKIN